MKTTFMRHLLTFSFLTFFVLASAQTYTFKPTWNVGDVKTIETAETTKSYKDGELLSDTTINHTATLKVVKDDGDAYIVEITRENVALKQVMKAFDDLGEELDDFQNLKLVYRIAKDTSGWELTNWEEVRDFVADNLKQIKDLVIDKDDSAEAMVEMIFKPIEDMFSSKENIEAYMANEIEFLTIPFQRTYEFQKTYATTHSEDNPFQPGQEITAMEKLTLEKVNKSNDTYEFTQEVILDLREFNKMMKAMIKSMAESMGVDANSAEAKNAEIDNMGMDMTNMRTVNFNKKTSWVTQSVVKAEVTVSMPQKGTNKTEITTVTTVK